MVAVHGLVARQGETSFALMVLRFPRPLERVQVLRVLERLGSLIADLDAVVADLPDEFEAPMRLVGVPWAPPEAGPAVAGQRRLVETAEGLEAAWFFQTGTSLLEPDDGDLPVWSHGPPPRLTTVPFPVDGYPAIVDGHDWEDFGLALKLAGPWTAGEALVLRGFHALWLGPYAMRYRNADVTIDPAHHAVHLWVDRFAVGTDAAAQVEHLLWIAAQLHQVLPVLHARFVGATMLQKYGGLMGEVEPPFVLGGNPLVARHAEGGEQAVDAWIATQTAWSSAELARMLDELAVDLVTRAPRGPDEVDADADDEAERYLHLAPYASELLAARAGLGELDPRAAATLRPILAVPAKYEHRRRAVVELLGALRDRASVPAMIRILEDNPIKGALDSIGKEDFLAATARALGAIGDPAAIAALSRVVAAKGPFNDKPRTYAANALAGCLAVHPEPRDVDDAVLVGLLDTIRERDDGPLNAHAHLAYGRLARTLAPARRAVAARMLAETPSHREDSGPMLARRAAQVLASGAPDPSLRDLLHRAFVGRSWDHDATVRDLAIALMIGELLPELVDPADLARLTRFAEPQVRAVAHALLARLGAPMPPARCFDRETARALASPELLRWLGEPHVIGIAALIAEAGRRRLAIARAAIVRLVADVVAHAHPSQDLLEPQVHLVTAAVAALRDPLDTPTVALFDRMLRHANHHVKWALLKDPPHDERLIGGMFHVLGERWGWQESTARDWLTQFQGTAAYEEERTKVGVESLDAPGDADHDEGDDVHDDADMN